MGDSKEGFKGKFLCMADTIGNIFFSPREVFQEIIKKEEWRYHGIIALLIFLGVTGALIGAVIAAVMKIFLGFFGGGFGVLVGVIPVLAALLIIILGFIAFLVWTLVTHLIAKYVFKGEGRFTSLLNLFGYLSIPKSLMILAIILLCISLSAFPLAMVLFGVSFVYSVILGVIIVEEEYRITAGRAFLSAYGIVPLVIGVVLSLVGGW